MLETVKTRNQIEQMVQNRVSNTNLLINADIKQTIDSITGKVENERLATGEKPFSQMVKDLRRKALNEYKTIKHELNDKIVQEVKEKIVPESVKAFQDKKTEEKNIQIEIKKVENEIEGIEGIRDNTNDFDLFLNFGGDAPRRRSTNSNNTETLDSVYNTVADTYEKYSSMKRRRIIAGVLVTLVFAVVDLYMIYSVFQASNMTIRTSIIAATLSAISLDVPPYLLGLLVFRRIDNRRVWHLRNDSNDPGEIQNDNIMKHAARALLFVIILLFLAYFLLRVLLFFGGGDFNKVMQSLFERKYHFESTDFNSSDLISTFVPFVTSVGAFVVSILLSFSEADYIQTAVTAIKNEMENCITECKNRITEYAIKQEDINEKIQEEKSALWAIYGKKGPIPDNDDFYAGVVSGGMKLHLPTYETLYQEQCAWLREQAFKTLGYINERLVPYSMNQSQTRDIQDKPYEDVALDYIWVNREGIDQYPNTRDTIAAINNQIKMFDL